jgi:hypothetical protein
MNTLVRDIREFTAGKTIHNAVRIIPLNPLTIEPGAKIMHGDVVDAMIKRKSSIKAHEYDVRTNGCKLSDLAGEELNCPHCGETRFKDDSNIIPKAAMKIMSIGDLLAPMLADQEKRQLLRYRTERESIPGVYKDVFDGSKYTIIKGCIPKELSDFKKCMKWIKLDFEIY